jgi:hypothetical protein
MPSVFGDDFAQVTHRTVGLATEGELRKTLLEARALTVQQTELLRDELGKRQTDKLISAIGSVEFAVNNLSRSSRRIQKLTQSLITETSNVHSQTVVLTESSHNIERLTKWLIGLTIVLGLLTLVLAADVALKYVPEHPQPTAPQTPPLPAPQSHPETPADAVKPAR